MAAAARAIGQKRCVLSVGMPVTLPKDGRADKPSERDVSRAFELSGSVARDLSGRHSAPKGVSYEADGVATGDPEDEI
jgi:hypothetical protein